MRDLASAVTATIARGPVVLASPDPILADPRALTASADSAMERDVQIEADCFTPTFRDTGTVLPEFGVEFYRFEATGSWPISGRLTDSGRAGTVTAVAVQLQIGSVTSAPIMEVSSPELATAFEQLDFAVLLTSEDGQHSVRLAGPGQRGDSEAPYRWMPSEAEATAMESFVRAVYNDGANVRIKVCLVYPPPAERRDMASSVAATVARGEPILAATSILADVRTLAATAKSAMRREVRSRQVRLSSSVDAAIVRGPVRLGAPPPIEAPPRTLSATASDDMDRAARALSRTLRLSSEVSTTIARGTPVLGPPPPLIAAERTLSAQAVSALARTSPVTFTLKGFSRSVELEDGDTLTIETFESFTFLIQDYDPASATFAATSGDAGVLTVSAPQKISLGWVFQAVSGSAEGDVTVSVTGSATGRGATTKRITVRVEAPQAQERNLGSAVAATVARGNAALGPPPPLLATERTLDAEASDRMTRSIATGRVNRPTGVTVTAAPVTTTDTDSIYIRGTSAPDAPSGGTSSENHLPSGWSRTQPDPTATENVYRSQRTLTYKDGSFTSATAWGSPTKVADKTGTPVPGRAGLTVSGGAKQITATATAPTSGGTPSRYRFQLSTSSSFSGTPTVMTRNSAGAVTFTGLAAGTTYYVRVRAENAGGNGSWSVTRSAATAAALPVAGMDEQVISLGTKGDLDDFRATGSWRLIEKSFANQIAPEIDDDAVPAGGENAVLSEFLLDARERSNSDRDEYGVSVVFDPSAGSTGRQDLIPSWERRNPAMTLGYGTTRIGIPGPNNSFWQNRDNDDPYNAWTNREDARWQTSFYEDIRTWLTGLNAEPDSTVVFLILKWG